MKFPLKEVPWLGTHDVTVFTLAASSGKYSATVWRPSIRLSVSLAHTQRDSPGAISRHGQYTFPSEYYEDGHTCYVGKCLQ